MATQQLLFDILATSKGVDKTFQEVADSADSMAGKLGAAGAKATQKLFSPMTAAAAGGIAGAALMSGLHTAIDMDSLTRKMTAGLGLTGPAAEKAGQVAGDLYKNAYGDSMEGVTDAVSAVMSSVSGMSSASQGDIEALTAKVMDLSSAFSLDVGRTAQIAGQMIKTGLAKDGAEAADLLAGTLQKVPVNLREDLLDAVDEYGPFFQQLGIQGSDAMGMLAKASEKGMYGIDKTGDALKEFTIRATDGSKSTEGAMEAIGLNAHDMALQVLAGGKTASSALGEIINGLTGMDDPAAQAQAALALFGTPLEDLGTDQIPTFLNSIDPMGDSFDKMEGAASKLGETINSGPAVAFTTFQRTAETTLGALGAQALPILTPLLASLTEFAPVIGPAVIALGALAAVIAVVNFVMAMSPVTWIIVGIVALIAAIAALVMNWDTVVAFLTQVWGGFVGWFQGIMAGFVGWWNEIWGGLGNWLTEVWNNIVGFLAGIWNVIAAAVMVGVHAVMDPIVNGFMAVWNFVSTVFTNIGNFIAGAWNWIASLVANIIAAFVQTHGDQIAAIWNNIVAVFTAIGNFFAGIWNWYIGIITGALQAVWGVVSAVFNAVWGFISVIFTAIGGFLGAVWNSIVGVISGAVGAVWGAIVSGFTSAWGFISWVFGMVGSFIGGVWGGIVSGVSGMVGSVMNVLGGLGDKVIGALSGAGNWLFDTGKHIVEGLISGISALAGTIGNAFLSLVPGWIVGPFKQALGIASPSKVFAGFGENIGEGVLVGVGRTQNRIDERMASLVTVPDVATSGPGAFSGPGAYGGRSAGGSTIDDLIEAIRSQRPVQVNGAPGMDEETLARATAEQLLWRG